MEINFDFACRDDCLDQMVPSDLRVLVGQRDKALEHVALLESRLSSGTQELGLLQIQYEHTKRNFEQADKCAHEREAQILDLLSQLAAAKAQVFARDVSVSPVALTGSTKESP